VVLEKVILTADQMIVSLRAVVWVALLLMRVVFIPRKLTTFVFAASWHCRHTMRHRPVPEVELTLNFLLVARREFSVEARPQ